MPDPALDSEVGAVPFHLLSPLKCPQLSIAVSLTCPRVTGCSCCQQGSACDPGVPAGWGRAQVRCGAALHRGHSSPWPCPVPCPSAGGVHTNPWLLLLPRASPPSSLHPQGNCVTISVWNLVLYLFFFFFLSPFLFLFSPQAH